MESPARRSRRTESAAGEPVNTLNAGLFGFGALLLVNGMGIAFVSALVPFSIDPTFVSAFLTAAFVLSIVWYRYGDRLGSSIRRRNSRRSGTRRRGF